MLIYEERHARTVIRVPPCERLPVGLARPVVLVMMRLEWNELRVGDHVLVHDPRDPEGRLLPGIVVEVDALDGSNDLGIRVKAEREAAVIVRPKRLVVHQDPRDPSERCWRCDAIALTRRAG